MPCSRYQISECTVLHVLHDVMRSSTSALSPSSTTAIATAVLGAGIPILATGILFRQRHDIAACYRRHRGMRGVWRLLWLGDSLPPRLRQSVDALDAAEAGVRSAEQQLDTIRILVARAALESVDGPTTAAPAPATATGAATGDEARARLFREHPELRTRIGIFSDNLDRLAAAIDAVQSYADAEVKRRKKRLSSDIVALMEGLDGMVASFDVESKESWEAALKELNLMF